MAQDLRTYLDTLVKHDPRQLKIVEEEIDPEFEAAAIVHKMEKDTAYPGFPAVLFKNIKGSPIPMLLNLHGTYERVALAIGTNVAGMGPELLQVPSRLGDADDGHVQPPTADQRLQGRKDLLVSEIARHPEDHQSVGPGSGRTGIPDGTAAGGRGHLRCVGH